MALPAKPAKHTGGWELIWASKSRMKCFRIAFQSMSRWCYIFVGPEAQHAPIQSAILAKPAACSARIWYFVHAASSDGTLMTAEAPNSLLEFFS
jgi:hypothetical protein